MTSTPEFRPFQWVRTTCELSWHHGSGIVLPAGVELQLLKLADTSSGPRWSARWGDVFVSYLPPDALTACEDLSEGVLYVL